MKLNLKSFAQTTINLGVFLIIVYASYLLILISLRYIYFEKNIDFLSTKQLIYHVRIWRFSFYTHVFTSPIVILAGILQFNRWLIRTKPKLHKTLGYIYIIVVLFITGPAAFVMSLYANGGRIAQTSFVILSVLWLSFTYLSYRKIRSGDALNHAKWNIRSYALTLSAVTLRFYAYMFDVINVNLGPKETYIIISYVGWIPNLLIAELLIYWKYPQNLLQYKKINSL